MCLPVLLMPDWQQDHLWLNMLLVQVFIQPKQQYYFAVHKLAIKGADTECVCVCVCVCV